MRCPRSNRSEDGVAIIIVMLIIFAMTLAAGVFAYSMKVEIRLAQNTRSSGELTWLGLSGVDYAKWWLYMEAMVPSQAAHQSLLQRWAGGPGEPDVTDDPLAGHSLKDVHVGDGVFSLEIVDAERRFPINSADLTILRNAVGMVAGDNTDAEIIANAVVDWRDRDGVSQPGRPAESEDYYLRLDPPYRAKDGPIDDMGEVLKIRGVTPEIFWGSGRLGALRVPGEGPPPPGLIDLFTALSSGQVNINTAPLPVLQLALGGDAQAATMAANIVREREGPEGPARNPGDKGRLLGSGAASPRAGNLSVFSTTYEVHIDARVGTARMRYFAVIQRRTPRDFNTMIFRPE
jgi:general secretion pathway protein K